MAAVWFSVFAAGMGILTLFGHLRRRNEEAFWPTQRIVALLALGAGAIAFAHMWNPVRSDTLSLTSGFQTNSAAFMSATFAAFGLLVGIAVYVALVIRGRTCHGVRLGLSENAQLWNRTLSRIASIAEQAETRESLHAAALDELHRMWTGEFAAVWRFVPDTDELALVASCGLSTAYCGKLHRMSASGSVFGSVARNRRLVRDSVRDFDCAYWPPIDQDKDVVILPYGTGANIGGFYLFAGVEQSAISADVDQETAAAVSSLIGTADRVLEKAMSAEFALRKLVLRRELHSTLAQATDLVELTNSLLDVVGRVMSLDTISLAQIKTGGRFEDRVTVRANESRVVERRKAWPIADELTLRVVDSGLPVDLVDLKSSGTTKESGASGRQSNLECSRSRLVVPIGNKNAIVGTLTIGHRLANRYGDNEIQLLDSVASELSYHLRRLDSLDREVRQGRYLTALAELPQNSDVHSVLRFARDKLNVAELVFGQIDQEQESIELTVRESASRIGRSQRWTDGQISLARVPWHRWAVRDQRVCRIDQSDLESLMPDEEICHVTHSDMRTGVIVPIVAFGRTVGTLAAFEFRDPGRRGIDDIDIQFLGAVASHLSGTALDRHAGAVGTTLRAIGQELLDPLTALVAGIELLRLQTAGHDSTEVNMIRRIEKASQTIQQEIEGWLLRDVELDAWPSGAMPNRAREVVVTVPSREPLDTGLDNNRITRIKHESLRAQLGEQTGAIAS